MKTTKILLGALRVSALIALFAMTPAQAQTVNVNFNSDNATYSGTGAAPDPGTVWNSVQWARDGGFPSSGYGQTATGLVNSTGGASLVTVSLYDAGGYNPYNAASAHHAVFADPLLSDEFYGGGSTIAISGLTVGGIYDLYLYSQNGNYNSDNTTFTFGTSKTAVNNAVGDETFTAGVNYVEFVLTADGSGDITGSYGGAAAGLDGLQVEAVPAVVPEPVSLATMSLVGMAMLLFCKRLKKQSV